MRRPQSLFDLTGSRIKFGTAWWGRKTYLGYDGNSKPFRNFYIRIIIKQDYNNNIIIYYIIIIMLKKCINNNIVIK